MIARRPKSCVRRVAKAIAVGLLTLTALLVGIAAPSAAGDNTDNLLQVPGPKSLGMSGKWYRYKAPCTDVRPCIKKVWGRADDSVYVFEASRFKNQQIARTYANSLRDAGVPYKVRTVRLGAIVTIQDLRYRTEGRPWISRVVVARYATRVVFALLARPVAARPPITHPTLAQWTEVAASKANPMGGHIPLGTYRPS